MEQSWMNKRVAEDGNVPFSPGSRNIKDDAHDRMNTLTKTTYGWKAPTYFKWLKTEAQKRPKKSHIHQTLIKNIQKNH